MREFDVRDLDRLPLAAKALCCAATAACVLAIGYFLVLANLRTEWAGEQRRHGALQAQHESKAALAPEWAAVRADRNQAAGEFAALARRLPAQADTTTVIESIGRAAVARGLVVANMALAQERETTEYIEQPIALALVGDYHNIGAFAGDLAALPLLVTTHDFEIKPAPDHAVDGTLTMTATLNTYRLAGSGTLPVAETVGAQQPSSWQAPTTGYRANRGRDPFQPAPHTLVVERSGGGANGPNEGRRRQPLERHPLEQLRLVGTLAANGERRALVQDPDGNVHTVTAGDYLGTNHGRIRSVGDASLQLVETVRDDSGGWLRRPRIVTMDAASAPPDESRKNQ